MTGERVPAVLEIEGLRIAFARYSGWFRRDWLQVIDGLDLRVSAGEVVAVVGASGGGKSLLAHAVLGILPANARVDGRMEYEGATLCAQRQATLRGRAIALVPQGVGWLDPSASARTQVGWAAAAAWRQDRRRPRNEANDSARDELLRFGMPLPTHRLRPFELSGGMARSVLLAAATIGRARLLIADEPTVGLDPARRDRVFSHLRTLADDGRAVIVVTHDLDGAVRVADRLVVVAGGRTVDLLHRADLVSSELPVNSYAKKLFMARPAHGMRTSEAPPAVTPRSPGVAPESDDAARIAPHAGRAPALSVRGLSYSWPQGQRPSAPLLDRLKLEIEPAGVVGLLGPSGCGKTTLARLLAGHLRLQRGAITVDGVPVPVAGPSPIQLVLQHAGHALDPRWRIRRSLREGWQPDEPLLERFGVDASWLDRLPHELSGGELQRIAIVRALLPGLRVLVLDEPTASLDTLSQARIWAALRAELSARGVAILVLSHDRDLLRALDARLMRLEQGRVVREAARYAASGSSTRMLNPSAAPT